MKIFEQVIERVGTAKKIKGELGVPRMRGKDDGKDGGG